MVEDVQHMQQQAARRVQQMQEHSRRVFEEYGGRTPESLRAAQPPDYTPPRLYDRPSPSTPTEKEVLCRAPDQPKGLPGGLDTEQILLLGLALLLFRNHCRVELVFALLYLAL